MTPRLRSVCHPDRALDGHVRRNNHVFRVNCPVSGNDAPPARLAYQDRAAVFEEAATPVRNGMRQSDKVFGRIELRLVGKTKRADRLEGKRCAVEYLRLQPDLPCSLCLGLDLFASFRVRGVGVCILAFQIAGDPIFPDPVLDQFDSCRIRLGIVARRGQTASVDQMAVDQRVLRGDLCCRAAGHLLTNLKRFDKDH